MTQSVKIDSPRVVIEARRVEIEARRVVIEARRSKFGIWDFEFIYKPISNFNSNISLIKIKSEIQNPKLQNESNSKFEIPIPKL